MGLTARIFVVGKVIWRKTQNFLHCSSAIMLQYSYLIDVKCWHRKLFIKALFLITTIENHDGPFWATIRKAGVDAFNSLFMALRGQDCKTLHGWVLHSLVSCPFHHIWDKGYSHARKLCSTILAQKCISNCFKCNSLTLNAIIMSYKGCMFYLYSSRKIWLLTYGKGKWNHGSSRQKSHSLLWIHYEACDRKALT